jgi:HAD superfamily hydrolase (TIGR01509 family)
MKLKGIIFDVDGTMADTEELHRQAFNEAFLEFNLNWHWSKNDYYKLLFISGGKERFKICLNEDKELKSKIIDPHLFIEELHQCKSNHYRRILSNGHIQLRPGIERLINEAQDKGLQLGIATSSCLANLNTLINRTLNIDPKEIFNTIISSDNVTDKKPSPIVYQCALAGLGLRPETCVAIEDTQNGNTAALNAGLQTIITTHSYTIDNDFTGASLVTKHLGDPKNTFKASHGYAYDKSYVDVELLNNIICHHTNRSSEFVLHENISNAN